MDIDPAHYHLPPDSADYSHDEEQKHFTRIMRAFKNYRSWHLKRIAEKERHFDSLPPNHRLLLKKFGDHFNMVRECILYNAEFIDEMILEAERMFLNEDYQCQKTEAAEPVRPADMDKVDSTMVQLVRDWSGAGSEERKASYGMVVQALEEEFSDLLPEERSETRVLVPGAGLGRLAFEIFRRGFSSEGNEYSMFMLVAANFMINRFSGELNSIKIYPWVPRFCNNLKAENQLKPVLFPDVRTSDSTSIANFTMIGGEFVDVYSKGPKNKWDSVATCFFLDTANNVLNYVETVFRILKPGGIWINIGPLLYHYADMKDNLSIEPPYDILKECIVAIGFKFEKEEVNVETPYACDMNSMNKNTFRSVFFVCRKPTNFEQS